MRSELKRDMDFVKSKLRLGGSCRCDTNRFFWMSIRGGNGDRAPSQA